MALAKFFLSKQVTSTCSTIIQMSSPTPTNLVAARIHQLDEPLRSHSVQEEALDESESRYANPQGHADSTRSALFPTDVNNVLTRFVQYSPQLEAASYRRKRLGWSRWRLDETSSKGKGQWRYLDRAVTQTAQTVDLLPTEQRDRDAALRFLIKAIRRHGMPETLTIEGSEVNGQAEPNGRSPRSTSSPPWPPEHLSSRALYVLAHNLRHIPIR
jgi:hypothetical protein